MALDNMQDEYRNLVNRSGIEDDNGRSEELK